MNVGMKVASVLLLFLLYAWCFFSYSQIHAQIVCAPVHQSALYLCSEWKENASSRFNYGEQDERRNWFSLVCSLSTRLVIFIQFLCPWAVYSCRKDSTIVTMIKNWRINRNWTSEYSCYNKNRNQSSFCLIDLDWIDVWTRRIEETIKKPKIVTDLCIEVKNCNKVGEFYCWHKLERWLDLCSLSMVWS